MDIISIKAHNKLNLIKSSDILTIAEQLLASDKKNDLLIQIVCNEENESDKIKELFDKFLLNEEPYEISTIDALRQFVKEISTAILNKKISPLDGAKIIWKVRNKSECDTHEFDPFIYVASEMEDRPSYRSFFERVIVEEAKNWATPSV